MGYSILTDTLAGEELISGLFDAQVLSYRKILPLMWRDTVLPIGEEKEVYDPNNDVYDALKEKFDARDAKEVSRILTTENDLAKAVNSVVKNKKRSIKSEKKQSARVMREVNKMRKRGYYGVSDKELEDALVEVHKAFRESFIMMRKTLRKDVYDCIPQDLKLDLNGEKHELSYFYIFDETVDKYRLRNDISLSHTDLRHLQLAIAPYIYAKIHHRK